MFDSTCTVVARFVGRLGGVAGAVVVSFVADGVWPGETPREGADIAAPEARVPKIGETTPQTKSGGASPSRPLSRSVETKLIARFFVLDFNGKKAKYTTVVLGSARCSMRMSHE